MKNKRKVANLFSFILRIQFRFSIVYGDEFEGAGTTCLLYGRKGWGCRSDVQRNSGTYSPSELLAKPLYLELIKHKTGFYCFEKMKCEELSDTEF